MKEIKDFLLNYNSEKRIVLNYEVEKLAVKHSETCSNLKQRIQNKTEIINFETEKIDDRISDLERKINIINTNDINFLKKIISSVKLYSLKKQSNYLVKNRNELVNASVKEITRSIENDEIFIREYEADIENLIAERAKSEIQRLEYTRNVLENSRNLISGAIGENLVVKEIKKLSDDYVLINNFNLKFSRPIFYKKHNQRIYSVQIDHLLISKAGIFIIETKNWSKSSVDTINLRSPIEQIERSSFALYVYISENIRLNEHHWGEQQIPIRNLIVMINNKPIGKFKYVKIKLLNELNDYLKFFEPVLTENQIDFITNKLL
ncbi:nuclease-related domain-containing protein [Frigoriflavimonas asaccharolytica]|uniref:NERD domain-containing protein n=1 Tax=Frigoriflavimonas asaccharolytica TaxID=2735899 RepID=A0A8J8G6A6_9FLAO|nr:nuclease-related domain-containing protein [Frigoriflavimonas asaccharolytica]NRS91806.1 hypothetical protein [Frigoriflavimonas asaccharolytica]